MFGRKSNSGPRHRSQLQRRNFLALESLESRNLLSGSPWQNPLACNDLDDDGSISAGDALVAINAINATGSGNLSERMAAPTLASGAKKYLDADGDSSLSASDVISVINAVNGGRASASAEAEKELPPTDEQPDEIGDDVPELTLAGGFTRVRSALNVAGDVDVYRVTAATTDLNVALFSRASGLTVSLVDEAGDVVATAESATGPRQPAVLNATLEVGTTYFIVISGGEEVTGGYCLQAIDTDSSLPPPHREGGKPSEDASPPRRLPPEELFAKLDADASGSLTLEEFSTLKPPKDAVETPEAVFTKLDANTDGSLSLAEFLTIAPPKPVEDDGDESDSEKPPIGNQKPPRGAPPAPANAFAHLDADTDDSLSAEEFAAFRLPAGVTTAIDELFAAWDTDSSSLLSLTEFEAGLVGLKKR